MYVRSLATAVCAALFLVVSAAAVPDGWTDDFAAAQVEAAAQDKDLLLEFTGSDWCPPCKMLKKEVFDQAAFNEAVPDDFVLVKLDFPNNVPQSDKVIAQNHSLQERYAIQGYPTVILTDAAGKPYAQTGYRPGGAEAYVTHLDEMRARKEARDQAMASAATAEGLDKAKALDQALDAVGPELAAGFYRDVIEQIIALDPEDTAGLKTKYGTMLAAGQLDEQMQEAFALLEQTDFEGGLTKLDEILSGIPVDDEQKQIIITIKGQVYAEMGENGKAVEMLREAIKVDPESQIAPQIQILIDQMKADTSDE